MARWCNKMAGRKDNWLCATPHSGSRSRTDGKAQLTVHRGLIRDSIVPSRGFNRTERKEMERSPQHDPYTDRPGRRIRGKEVNSLCPIWL
jgi:hypothetical protein